RRFGSLNLARCQPVKWPCHSLCFPAVPYALPIFARPTLPDSGRRVKDYIARKMRWFGLFHTVNRRAPTWAAVVHWDARSAAAGIAPAAKSAAATNVAAYRLSVGSGGAESLHERIEVRGRDVGDRPIGDAIVGPRLDVVAGDLRLGHRRRATGGQRAD